MTNKDIRNLSSDMQKKIQRLGNAMKNNLPVIVGKIAVDQFRENFRQGGFVNGGLKKWADVKRRDSASPWYGFEYKGEKRTSYKLTRDRKTGKTRKAEKQSRLNFSATATMRNPLCSKRMELYNSLRYIVRGGDVAVVSDKPYAEVQNNGGTIKVFGKHPVKLPARPFAGQSNELDNKVENEIVNMMNQILKQ